MPRNHLFFRMMLFALLIVPAATAGHAWAAADSENDPLALERVTLFNNGVGYFQLRGMAPAGKGIHLRVKESQMNDLLKSLTVLNLTSGQVSSIVYDNDKTIAQKLDEFDFQLQKAQGLPQILRQLQGSKVQVFTGSSSISGTIMGVEKRNIQEEKMVTPWFFLTIMDRTGQMRSIDTAEVTGITLEDEALNSDLKRYLSILFGRLQKNGKSISIVPMGQGPQDLLVGYVTEVPVWKATYRIVLPGKEAEKPPFLQGWAIVDNVSGKDWQNVQLSLVSGMPVSFIQQLYAPRFKQRPELKVADEGAVSPTVPETAMAEKRMMMASPPSPMAKAGALKKEKMEDRYTAETDMAANIRKLKAQTVTRELGDMFEYRIEHPVTIEQNRSALVPIVSTDIEGEAVDLYNERTQPRHPLAGVRLKNTTGLTLEGGPLTVLQGGIYAGEAFIKSLKPNEKRYITYAVDLGLYVDTKRGSTTEPVDRVVINRGIMRLHRGIIETKTYNLNNKNARPKAVVIEHPYHSGWKLLEPPQALEVTDNYQRFEITVAAGDKSALTVKEMRDYWESFSVSNLTPDNLLIFARQKYLDDATLKQLEEIVAIKAEISRIESSLNEIQKERDQIFKDQKRLRENLKGLGQTSDEKGLRSRYIQQLDSQETRLDEIREKEATLKSQRRNQQNALEKRISDLSVDLRI